MHPVVAIDHDMEILVIDGVGNPATGELVAAVRTTLEHAAPRRNFRVTECNWNQIVEPSAKDGAILYSAWEDLSLALARASAIGEGSPATGRLERLLRIVAGVALLIAELGLAAALAALFGVTPLVIVFFFVSINLAVSNNEANYALGVHPTLVLAQGCLVAALGGLTASFFRALLAHSSSEG